MALTSNKPRIFEKRSEYNPNLVYRVVVKFEDSEYVYGKCIGWISDGTEIESAFPKDWFDKWGFIEKNQLT